MKINLFEDFPKHSKEDWMAQIIKDLKGKDYEKTLTSVTEDGIKIEPIYTIEDRKGLEVLDSFRNRVNPESLIPGMPPRIWANVCSFEGTNEKSMNGEILDALLNGADALLLHLSGEEDLEVMLEGVQAQYIQIFLSPKEDPIKVFKQFLDWINRNKWPQESILGGILWDGFAFSLTNKIEKKIIVDTAVSLLQLGEELTAFKLFSINSAIYHDSGASSVQELAFGLSAWVDLIDAMVEEGFYPNEIIQKTVFRLAVGTDYFIEIAKLKAARVLINRLIRLYQVEIPAEDIFIFVQTSFWTKTMWDTETNMVRNTTEAMTGILGGANALYVLPHDIPSGYSGLLSQRMARNVSNILKEESYFDKILDPVSGSYFIENMILAIFQKVKEYMETIEGKGGWWTCYESCFIQNEVRTRRNIKMKQVLEGEKTKIGVNKYIFKKENFPKPNAFPVEESWQLLPFRESMSVENLETLNP